MESTDRDAESEGRPNSQTTYNVNPLIAPGQYVNFYSPGPESASASNFAPEDWNNIGQNPYYQRPIGSEQYDTPNVVQEDIYSAASNNSFLPSNPYGNTEPLDATYGSQFYNAPVDPQSFNPQFQPHLTEEPVNPLNPYVSGVTYRRGSFEPSPFINLNQSVPQNTTISPQELQSGDVQQEQTYAVGPDWYPQNLVQTQLAPLASPAADVSGIEASPSRTVQQESASSTVTPAATTIGISKAASKKQADKPSPGKTPPETAAATKSARKSSKSSQLPEKAPPLPAGRESGIFVVHDADTVRNAVGAVPMPNAPFMFMGPSQIQANLSNVTIPVYNPRKSRNEISQLEATLKTGAAAGTITRRSVMKSDSKRPQPRPSVPSIQARRRIKIDGAPSESDSESSSDSSLEIEPRDTEMENSPLPLARPKDDVGAVRYDTIKALWRPRQSGISGDEVRRAMAEYWAVVKSIRDDWNAVEKDEADKKIDDAAVKARLSAKRDLMASAIATALEFGHTRIVESLALNVPFTAFLRKVLLDRMKEDDVNGSLVKDTLELLARCKTITESILDQVKLNKVTARLAKKGDEKTKDLIKQISDNAKKAKSEKAEELKPSVSGDGASRASDLSSGSKRPRPDDTETSEQPSKKVASSSALNPSKTVSGAAKSTASTDRRTTATAQTSTKAKPSSSAAASKPKPAHVAAKPTNFFADAMQSASKVKPAPKAAVRPSAAEGISVAATSSASATVAAPPRPAFSLFETLDNLNKPKEADKAKEVNKAPPETPEERVRRLRKEERRKLRVSFRPDDELVQVRYFTHDDSEELGRAYNLLRDAGDAVSEGHMFKQHKEMDVGDEEDDVSREEAFRAWKNLIPIEFDVIKSEKRAEIYSKRGGLLNADSPDRKEQEEHEARTLMVVYTDIDDIPASPKEPRQETLLPASEIPVPVTQDGTGHAQVQTTPYAAHLHTPALPDMPAAARGPTYSVPAQAYPTAPATLVPQQTLGYLDPSAYSLFENTCNYFRDLNGRLELQSRAEAQAGIEPSPEVVEHRRLMHCSYPPDGRMPEEYVALAQQKAAVKASVNVNDILATLSRHTLNQHQQQQQQLQLQPQPQPQPQPQNGNANPGQGGFADQHDGQDAYAGRGRGGGWGHNKGQRGGQNEHKQFDNKFTVPCKYFLDGRCAKGKNCTYIHETK
ncbi:MAG: hypothetical protein M1825_004962 [Sarcosagium campestre]|nr:MAG: hypothetical protein M1825_004962 [Sarcosagium campestre]